MKAACLVEAMRWSCLYSRWRLRRSFSVAKEREETEASLEASLENVSRTRRGLALGLRAGVPGVPGMLREDPLPLRPAEPSLSRLLPLSRWASSSSSSSSSSMSFRTL